MEILSVGIGGFERLRMKQATLLENNGGSGAEIRSPG